MKKKVFQTPIELKENGDEGEFRAVFSRFNVIDYDGDVTKPGAFKEDQSVRISYWGHRWHDLPVGKGVIHQDEEKAWVDGQFFMDTMAGKETYQTVKNLGELQQWSYGFEIIRSSRGQFDEQEVQFLEELETFEISPVLLGAGIDTATEMIKAQKRLESADDWQTIRAKVLENAPKCEGCGEVATEVEHIIPLRDGGTNDISNLRACCKNHYSSHKKNNDAKHQLLTEINILEAEIIARRMDIDHD